MLNVLLFTISDKWRDIVSLPILLSTPLILLYNPLTLFKPVIPSSKVECSLKQCTAIIIVDAASSIFLLSPRLSLTYNHTRLKNPPQVDKEKRKNSADEQEEPILMVGVQEDIQVIS